ncbi:MAG TPA: hypothetical protein VE621_12530 [Bryobacteraceae bacterium]|jgi:hypothetical protein|nr:hypothetical protein [Bryobacteraceae bacterium]
MLIAFTLLHVIISLIGIGTGFTFAWDLLSSRQRRGLTNVFLATTIATSVTGFVFPVHQIMPSHVVGAISLVVLVLALWARTSFNTKGTLRRTYVLSTIAALYLNVFVLVVQMFQKIAPLKALAPTQSEPPFAIAQGVVLLGFAGIAWLAAKRFYPAVGRAHARAAALA